MAIAAGRLTVRAMAESPLVSAMARRLGQLAWTACVMARDSSELRPLADGVDLTAAEVKAHLDFGGVLHLSDLVLRRWRLGMWNPGRAREVLPRLRRVIRRSMSWSHARWNEEVERCEEALANWQPPDPSSEPTESAPQQLSTAAAVSSESGS